jgi:hypothetical protein
MRNLRAPLLLAATIGMSTLVVGRPSPALAQSAPGNAAGKEQAKKLFEEGVELEKKADYAGALAKYKDALQIAVTAGLRFHAGYCLEMTGKLAGALEEYEAADRLAREQNKHEVHAATTARLDPLRARVPQIAIRLATPAKDAEVQLDGTAVAGPLVEGGKAFRLDPGEHVVTARAPGYKPFSRKVQVPESVTTTVDVSLEHAAAAPVVAGAGAPAGAAPATAAPGPAPTGSQASAGTGAGDTAPPPVTEPPADTARGPSRVLPIVTTAGAVVLAGTGVAMFLAAGSAQTKAQDDCATLVSCDDRRSKVRTFDALALGGFIGAVGLGVVSVVLWTSKPSEHASAAARIHAGPGSVALEGRF